MTTLIQPAVVSSLRRLNHIINGNFDIWQRGISFTTSPVYTADRWRVDFVDGTSDTNQQSFVLGQTDVPNEPTYFARTTLTTGGLATSFHILAQRIEGVRTLAGKEVTLSFWAKADSSKNIATEVTQFFGTGGTPSATVNTIGVTTHALTTSWQKFIVNVTIPSISGKTLGTNNDDFVQIIFWFEAGSNFDARTNSLGTQSGTFDIAQVQLEEGNKDTDFEFRHIAEELDLCLRYFEKRGQDCVYSYDSSLSSSATDRQVDYMIEKRIVPTITPIDQVGNVGVISYWQSAGVVNNISSFTVDTSFGNTGFVVIANSLSTSRGLIFGYEADAEL